MISLSLCMIIKDEEEVLARCLECVNKIVDEIIIVDTGSSDKSKEIARRYTDKVYSFTWEDDFAKARNFSFSKATKMYIIWLDADDVLLAEEQAKLLKLKYTLDSKTDVVYMPYHMISNDKKAIESTFWRERIVKSENQFKWQEPVHEYIACSGNIIKVDIAVVHMKAHSSSDRNLRIFESYLAKGNKLTPRQYFYYARELYVNHKLDEAIKYYHLFLKNGQGLKSNYLYACMELSNCYKIKQDEENSLRSLLKYLEIDVPRAEICCKIGDYYRIRNEYEKAIEWYKLAPYTKVPKESIGAIMPRYWNYTPYMGLCVCYYKLGDLEQAIYYNEQAAKAEPNDEKILTNRYILAKEKLNKVNQK